ncbi:hypothetical protein XENORESO_016909 [Xenotaenia resolanae]|uniref:Transducer of regulated CREB activity middle domain-containing protein n=1 Tax=Xenotaenia resolanae TaxID=208358 RepID=A0ABV0WPT8_9TELE
MQLVLMSSFFSYCVNRSPAESLFVSHPFRTNSDSALHTSVMNPPMGDRFSRGGPALNPQGSRRSGQSDAESRRSE